MLKKNILKSISDAIVEKQSNFVIDKINDDVLRLAVIEGTFDWHSHPESDELFMVLEGSLRVEFRDQEPIVLNPGETLAVPAGKIHRTVAEVRTVNLCFEKAEASTRMA